MKLKLLTVSIILFLYIHTYGQNDHLEPVKDFSKYGGELKEYYDVVFPLLYKEFIEKPLARYTVMPSFESEYALLLGRDSLGNSKLTSHVFSENYWYAENKKEVKLIENSKRIDSKQAERIRRLFEKVTNSIKNPEEMEMGLDGVTYYFSYFNDNGKMITGEKWSPEDGTRMKKLVEICDSLMSFTQGKNRKFEEIEKSIDSLIKDLK